MTAPGTAGFTLVELLLAMTITALIATSALATLEMFVESNARAIESIETKVDVERALQLVRRDVGEASTLTFGVRQVTITRVDGTAIGYGFPDGGYELQRVTGSSAAIVVTKLAAAQLAATKPVYDSRGRLRDGSYNASTVVQGAASITMTPVTARRNGATIGVSMTIVHNLGIVTRSSTCTAVSLVLAETHAKP